MEEWRPVAGYEGWYEISSLGRVKRVAGGQGAVPGRILAQRLHQGYPTVGLTRGNRKEMKSVATLVAEAFLGRRPEGMEVNHIDGVKTNSLPSNLEYVTRRENMRHASRLGLWKNSRKGEEATRVRLSTQDVQDIRLMFGTVRQRNLAALFEIDRSHLQRIAGRRAWKHVG